MLHLLVICALALSLPVWADGAVMICGTANSLNPPDEAREVRHLSAQVGDNVMIECDGFDEVYSQLHALLKNLVWERNGVNLTDLNEDYGVRVLTNGSLTLTRVQLNYAGNYTCTCSMNGNTDIRRTHVLTVHTIPEVKVTPKIQSRRPGEEASMLCHVTGEPFPEVEWLKNDEPLKMSPTTKYMIVGNGKELRVRDIAFTDAGNYMCQASNIGGITRDISSLIVQEEPTPSVFSEHLHLRKLTELLHLRKLTAAPNEERRFFAFHDWGISVYEPNACRLYRQIQSTDIISGTQKRVCGEEGVKCSWSQAINVANQYIYVTQPMNNRVLVISKIKMAVVDVVVTDERPVALHYVPHLDQVWVLNRRLPNSQALRTIQVIRDAAKKRKHHTVRPQTLDNPNNVRYLFIPPTQDVRHLFKYGYVNYHDAAGLSKLDLATMKYVTCTNLIQYNCMPHSIQFSAYGMIIVECEDVKNLSPTGQLVMDSLTDSVISHEPKLLGRPYISPDSRTLVTIDRASHRLLVQNITEKGLTSMFDVTTTFNISDITFYPSQTTHGYDLYASSIDKEDILFLNLLTGKVEMITGVGRAMEPSLAEWGNPNRVIEASGVFGHFMVSPANETLFVVNGESRTVNCEIGGLVHPRIIVWVTMDLP